MKVVGSIAEMFRRPPPPPLAVDEAVSSDTASSVTAPAPASAWPAVSMKALVSRAIFAAGLTNPPDKIPIAMPTPLTVATLVSLALIVMGLDDALPSTVVFGPM